MITDFQSLRNGVLLGGLLVAAWLTSRLCVVRRRYKDLPTPPHSFLLGNLPILIKEILSMPKGSYFFVVLHNIKRKYDLPEIFYLDIWPLMEPQVIISDPMLVRQVVQGKSYNRHPIMTTALGPLLKKGTISTDEPQKRGRALFASAFSVTSLLPLVPILALDLKPLRAQLQSLSRSGEVFSMKDLCVRFTIQVGGRLCFNQSLDAFGEDNPWVVGIADAVAPSGFSLIPFSLLWRYIPWNRKCLRVEKLAKDRTYQCYENGQSTGYKSPSVVNVAFKAYNRQRKDTNGPIEKEFIDMVAENAKEFIVAGHDTTASTMAYSFYLLSQHPEALKTVQEEHDRVFGSNREKAWDLIQEDPLRLNELHWTEAVAKETLRLFSVGGVLKIPPKGDVLEHEGQPILVEGHAVNISHIGLGRNPKIFEEPDKFLPQRFLPDAERQIPRDAFRPFERGPKECLGKDLAMMELKLILLFTLREFRFTPAYDKTDARSLDCYGGQAYQVTGFGPTPAKGLPMRVHLISEL